MTVLDTTEPVCAVGGERILRDACIHILRAGAKVDIDADKS